jgi:hypothetical protein
VFDGFDIVMPGPRSAASLKEAWKGGGGRSGGGGASGSFDDPAWLNRAFHIVSEVHVLSFRATGVITPTMSAHYVA